METLQNGSCLLPFYKLLQLQTLNFILRESNRSEFVESLNSFCSVFNIYTFLLVFILLSDPLALWASDLGNTGLDLTQANEMSPFPASCKFPIESKLGKY